MKLALRPPLFFRPCFDSTLWWVEHICVYLVVKGLGSVLGVDEPMWVHTDNVSITSTWVSYWLRKSGSNNTRMHNPFKAIRVGGLITRAINGLYNHGTARVKISQNVDILVKVYLVHCQSLTLSNLMCSKYIFRSNCAINLLVPVHT